MVGGDGALEVLLGTASHGWCVVLKVNKTREVGEEGVKRVVVCWHKEGKKALTHAHKEGEKKKKKGGKESKGFDGCRIVAVLLEKIQPNTRFYGWHCQLSTCTQVLGTEEKKNHGKCTRKSTRLKSAFTLQEVPRPEDLCSPDKGVPHGSRRTAASCVAGAEPVGHGVDLHVGESLLVFMQLQQWLWLKKKERGVG